MSVVERVLEPQLMEENEQARAYAYADFSEAHNAFVARLKDTFAEEDMGRYVLDLGCGPGDVSIRFARAYPSCIVHGVDGSAAMLKYGDSLLEAAPDVRHRVELVRGMLPDAALPRDEYDSIISNSLLHHLPDPQVMWRSVTRYARQGAPISIMDLTRPASEQETRGLVETYSSEEPKVLQRDFYNSLLAAFTIDEIKEQLSAADLGGLAIEQISDRHVVISGRRP